MWIVQISDLHNSDKCNSGHVNKIASEMIEVINEKIPGDELLVFSICGDIINKGIKSGFGDTKEFLDKIIKGINTKKIDYVLCPGNHDIVEEKGKKSFNEFDKFTFKLTSSTNIKFQANCVNMKTIDNTDFIMINSSYHRDKDYGMVDLTSLNKILQQSKKSNIIILIHHHLIPIRKQETSTLVNAYEFLRNIEKFNVLAILHGHQHMKMQMIIGDNLCRVMGVGSILTEIETNYNNQFNMLHVSDEKIVEAIGYKYHSDEIGKDTLGKFVGANIL